MNGRVTNLVAVELAVLIGLMSWMAFRLTFAERRTSPDMQESVAEPVATIAHLSETRQERPSTIDSSADRRPVSPPYAQPIPMSQNVQQLPAQPYVNAAYESPAVAAESPTYAQSDEATGLVPSDYAASEDTIAYAQPAPILVYPVPYQVVVFSNSHRFPHRRRATFQSGPFTTDFPRRGNAGAFHPGWGGMANRQNRHPSVRGDKPPGHR